MRTLYLIRHTTPAIEPGICYGQSDIDVVSSFQDEADAIRNCIPEDIDRVYSSPLKRCRKLADYLFPEHHILFRESLMEINCGWWEMKRWNDIPKEETDPWMNDFVRVRMPGGESYTDLHKRVTQCFDGMVETGNQIAIITHGGVIRSLLSHVTRVRLEDSFNRFSINYGCVIKMMSDPEGFRYEMIPGITTKKESHKPSH